MTLGDEVAAAEITADGKGEAVQPRPGWILKLCVIVLVAAGTVVAVAQVPGRLATGRRAAPIMPPADAAPYRPKSEPDPRAVEFSPYRAAHDSEMRSNHPQPPHYYRDTTPVRNKPITSPYHQQTYDLPPDLQPTRPPDRIIIAPPPDRTYAPPSTVAPPKAESPKQESSKPESPNPAPPKSEPLNLEPAKPEPPPASSPEPLRSELKASPGNSASVQVAMTGPDSAIAGQPVAYEITVRNPVAEPIHQVKVQQDLPAELQYRNSDPPAEIQGRRLSWQLGTIDAGAEKRIRLIVVASEAGDLRAQATVTFATTCQCNTRFTKPKLLVAVSASESAAVGEEVAFRITLNNEGSAPVRRVILRARLSDGLYHPQGQQIEADIGAINAGESRKLTLRATAAKSGQHVCAFEAMAAGDGDAGIRVAGGKTAEPEATAKATIRIVKPELSVRQTGPKQCLVRGEAMFTIEVSNPGSGATQNVRVFDRLPDGTDFVAASDGGSYDPATRTIRWTLPSLEANAVRVLTVRAKCVAMQESANVIVAEADANLRARSEQPVKIDGVPAIAVEVVDLDDPSPIRTDAIYEIRVLNQGTCPCTNIQIKADLPDGMVISDVQAPSGHQLHNDRQLIFAPYGKLAPRADLVYRVKVQSKVAGDVRFKIELTCDQLQRPVVKEESSRFFQP